MAYLLGSRLVKGNMGSTVLLSNSYKGTGSIPHADCKYLVSIYTLYAGSPIKVGCREGWENDSSHGQRFVLNKCR